MHGSNLLNQGGEYPSLRGEATSTSTPGSRMGHCGAFDPLKREYWLFGGFGRAEIAASGADVVSVVSVGVSFAGPPVAVRERYSISNIKS